EWLVAADPRRGSGSGADRLRLVAPSGNRFEVEEMECQQPSMPGVPTSVAAMPVGDVKRSHQWGALQFKVPPSERSISHYDVRYSSKEITTGDPTTFERALQATQATIAGEALMVPTTGAAGTPVEVEFGGMDPEKRYWIAIRAV